MVKDAIVWVVKLSEKPMKHDPSCVLGVAVSVMNHWQQTKDTLQCPGCSGLERKG